MVKPDCISIDYDVEPSWILEKASGIPIQGGLDPKILLGSTEDLKKNIMKYISIFSNYPYIFNLGHGVLPETKPETIDFIVKFIREKKMIKQKICIIGNGLTGLTAALILGKLNLDVHLIAAPDKKRRRDIRTTAISESNYKGLIGFIGKKF